MADSESSAMSGYAAILAAQLAAQKAQWKHEQKVLKKQKKQEAAVRQRELQTQQEQLAAQQAAEAAAKVEQTRQSGLNATTGGSLKSLNLGVAKNTGKSPISGTAPLQGMPGFRAAPVAGTAALPQLASGATVPTLADLVPSLTVPGASTLLKPGTINLPNTNLSSLNPLGLTKAQQRQNILGAQKLAASGSGASPLPSTLRM